MSGTYFFQKVKHEKSVYSATSPPFSRILPPILQDYYPYQYQLTRFIHTIFVHYALQEIQRKPNQDIQLSSTYTASRTAGILAIHTMVEYWLVILIQLSSL